MNASTMDTSDELKRSPAETALWRADIQTPARIAQIREIRAEIKAGKFLTPERIDGTVERLLEILG